MPTLPIPDASNTQGTVACYDVTEDWTPIYDKSALPGYYMACGTSGNQFKNAGVAGRLMREIIEACEAGRDIDHDPLQFQLRRIGGSHAVSSATFSRRRAPKLGIYAGHPVPGFPGSIHECARELFSLSIIHNKS
jgi:sarcosine oxidase subunit beta